MGSILSSPNPQILDPKTEPLPPAPPISGSNQDNRVPNPCEVESVAPPPSPDGGSNPQPEDPKAEEEEEEEEECGFCVFMKGGGCKDAFVAWEKCIEDVQKEKGDIVEKCSEVTSNLKKCMYAHADYYEPILRAEREMEDSITEQESMLEKEEEEVESASQSKS